MELGVIGLGRMGQIVVNRSLDAGHDVWSRSTLSRRRRQRPQRRQVRPPRTRSRTSAIGWTTAARRQGIWLMVPAGERSTPRSRIWSPPRRRRRGRRRRELQFQESVRRAGRRTPPTSTAASGRSRQRRGGFSLMIGGPEWAYEALVPIFDAVATGPAGHDRMGESGSGPLREDGPQRRQYALMLSVRRGVRRCSPRGATHLDMESVARTWNNGAVIGRGSSNCAREAFHGRVGSGRRRRPRRRRVHRDVDGSGERSNRRSGPIIYQALAERSTRNEGASRGGSRTSHGTDSGATRSRGARTR